MTWEGIHPSSVRLSSIYPSSICARTFFCVVTPLSHKFRGVDTLLDIYIQGWIDIDSTGRGEEQYMNIYMNIYIYMHICKERKERMKIIQSHLALYILIFLCSFAVKDTLYLGLSRIRGPQSITVYLTYTMILLYLMGRYQDMAADYFRGTFLIAGPKLIDDLSPEEENSKGMTMTMTE